MSSHFLWWLPCAALLAATETNFRLVSAPWLCTVQTYGCTDPSADNYMSYAVSTPHMCEYGGCNDTDAVNFDMSATYNDGSCTYHRIGCTVHAAHAHTWI